MAGSVETERVEPEQILKDLRKLWADLAKEDESGVLRACAMTLIVVIDEAEDPSCISETLAGLVHDHPSRAIVVRVRQSNGLQMQGRVFAQCWMPFGKRQQICCEQIEIVCSRKSVADAVTVIRGVVVPDLPVVVYCPDASLSQSPEVQELVSLATKVIIDSSQAINASPLIYLRRIAPGLEIGDLLWGRLTPWREAIARIFENAENRKQIANINRIRISYAGAPSQTAPAQTYLRAWFQQVLGSNVSIDLIPTAAEAYASIAKIDMQGDSFVATVEITAANTAEISAGPIRQKLVFPAMTECDVLRSELAITGRDRVFDGVVQSATVD